jgi:hypothetical protein
MKEEQITPKIIDVDLKDGLTFTALVDKNKIIQHHFPLNIIESFFGGNPKINKTTKI